MATPETKPETKPETVSESAIVIAAPVNTDVHDESATDETNQSKPGRREINIGCN